MQVNGTTRLPIVITLAQQKGGVGKTTTAAYLGVGLAEGGKKCLMIDLASSGNLTSVLGFIPESIKLTTSDLFMGVGSPGELIKSTAINNLKLIPANASLSATHRSLYLKRDYELVLRRLLSQPFFSEFDVLILDCPPGLDSININAIASADLVILPVVCDFFSLQTLNNMFRLINIARERANPDLTYRILINKLNTKQPLQEQIFAQIKSHYKTAILKTFINEDGSIPESQIMGSPLLTDKKESQATRQFRALSNEILSLDYLNQIIQPMKKVKP